MIFKVVSSRKDSVTHKALTRSNSRNFSNFGALNVSIVVVSATTPSMDMAGIKLMRSGFWFVMSLAAGVPWVNRVNVFKRSQS